MPSRKLVAMVVTSYPLRGGVEAVSLEGICGELVS